MLSSTVPCGTWTSNDVSIATVDPTTGVVTGVATGTDIITYTASGCTGIKTVTILPVPAITGGPDVQCGGTAVTLSAMPSGAWASSDTNVATITPVTGVVTGEANGPVTIYCTSVFGCVGSYLMTVTPPIISGGATICPGFSTTLTADVPGGTWSSSNPSIASVTSGGGVVTGHAAGAITISYTTGGCLATFPFSVIAAPTIGGSSSVCIGAPITLTPSGSGTWTSSNPSVATVSLTGGTLTGVAVGTSYISYHLGGCTAVALEYVQTSYVWGPSTICAGQPYTYSGSPTWAGSTFSSSNPGILSFPSPGVGTGNGVSAGTVIVTFTSGFNTCFGTMPVTVLAAPAPTGPGIVCGGASIGLGGVPPGMSWSSSMSGVASVNSSGVVTGLNTGTCIITCTDPGNGCYGTHNVTCYAPYITSPPPAVCSASPFTFTFGPAGGTWSSTNSSAVNVNASTGYVTYGGSIGASTVGYTVGGCPVSISLNGGPTPTITSALSSPLCSGSNLGFYSGPGGYTWSSSNPAALWIDGTTGQVYSAAPYSGLSSTFTVYYTSILGCSDSRAITINQMPTAGCCWPGGTVSDPSIGYCCCSSGSSCWGPFTLSAAPDLGATAWSFSNINHTTIISSGPNSQTDVTPHLTFTGGFFGYYYWSSGDVYYTINYTGHSCQLHWSF